MAKCPFRHYEQRNTCLIIFPRKILGSFSANYGPADVMTFFFWSSPDVWGKLDVGRREDLFFVLHPMFGGKLDVGVPEHDFGVGGSYALPSFGPVCGHND